MAELILKISFFISLFSCFLIFLRLLKGPSISDRAIALDTMTIIGISLIVFFSFFLGRAIFLDIAGVYGLISFLGIIALARYIEGGL